MQQLWDRLDRPPRNTRLFQITWTLCLDIIQCKLLSNRHNCLHRRSLSSAKSPLQLSTKSHGSNIWSPVNPINWVCHLLQATYRKHRCRWKCKGLKDLVKAIITTKDEIHITRSKLISSEKLQTNVGWDKCNFKETDWNTFNLVPAFL